MKEIVRKIKAFVLFDFPVEAMYIHAQFVDTQSKLQTEIPGWSTKGTRQKLISAYWFTYVPGHFLMILGLPVLVLTLLLGGFGQGYLAGIMMAGLVSFPVLYLFHYQPVFGSQFLPRLETVKEIYEQKELEQLDKCRKAQLPNATLVLIHYAIDKASSMNALQANEQFAGLLMQLYGVDLRSLKNNMDLLLGSSIKRKELKGRGRTEIFNRFNEAYQFFEEIGFSKGIEILKQLEVKFM